MSAGLTIETVYTVSSAIVPGSLWSWEPPCQMSLRRSTLTASANSWLSRPSALVNLVICSRSSRLIYTVRVSLASFALLLAVNPPSLHTSPTKRPLPLCLQVGPSKRVRPPGCNWPPPCIPAHLPSLSLLSPFQLRPPATWPFVTGSGTCPALFSVFTTAVTALFPFQPMSWECLPSELQIFIVSKLPFSDLLSCRRVNRRMRDLVDQNKRILAKRTLSLVRLSCEEDLQLFVWNKDLRKRKILTETVGPRVRRSVSLYRNHRGCSELTRTGWPCPCRTVWPPLWVEWPEKPP